MTPPPAVETSLPPVFDEMIDDSTRVVLGVASYPEDTAPCGVALEFWTIVQWRISVTPPPSVWIAPPNSLE